MAGRSLGIGARLILFCLALYFAVASLITVGEAMIVSGTVRREGEAQIDALGRTSIPALTQALWNYDFPIIELALRGLAMNSAVGEVRLLDPDGSIRYDLHASYPGAETGRTALPATANIGTEYRYRLAYTRQDNESVDLGELVILSSHSSEQRRFRETLALGLRGVLVLVLFLSLILAVAVEHFIGHPARDFARQIAMIDAADPGSARLAVPRDAFGELAYIAKSFMEMVAKIGTAMSALRASEQRMRSLFEESPISIWEEDFSEFKRRLEAARGPGPFDWVSYFEPRARVIEYASLVRLIDVNSATLSLLGYEDKDAAFKAFFRNIEDESLDILRAEFIALASGHTSFGGETVHCNSRNRRAFIQVKLSVVPGHEESLSQVIVSMVDLTERRRAEQALRESEAKYRCLVEQSAEGIILIDAAGALVEANPKLEQMTGLGKERAIGRKIWEIEYELCPEDSRSEEERERIRKKWEGAIAGECGSMPAGPFETLIANGAGLSRIVEQIVFPICMGSGRMTGAILRDITEQRKMTNSLSESLQEKELLLQEVHHRVKNNLQIICSLIDLQLNEINEYTSTKSSLMDIEARVRSISLVHELLYQADNLAYVDFSSYIDQLIAYLSEIYRVDNRQIKIVASIGDVSLGLDKAIPCGLLINEMVTNSLKYAFPDGRKGTIHVSMAREDERNVLLTVSDDGIGINKDALEMKEHLSVGLSLVKSLISQLGGRYEMKTDPSVELHALFHI